MAQPDDKTISHFVASYADQRISVARFAVLDVVPKALYVASELVSVSAFVARDPNLSGLALVSRIGSELIQGTATLLREQNAYSASALLRQLVEVEYLMLQGYADIASLGSWFTASSEALRSDFTPQKMRNQSGGLFRDQEYWMHCELGGHPNPKARTFFAARSPVDVIHFVLPDTVQHTRRLWNSFRLLIPSLDLDGPQVDDLTRQADAAIGRWADAEHPVILQFDGMPR